MPVTRGGYAAALERFGRAGGWEQLRNAQNKIWNHPDNRAKREAFEREYDRVFSAHRPEADLVMLKEAIVAELTTYFRVQSDGFDVSDYEAREIAENIVDRLTPSK